VKAGWYQKFGAASDVIEVGEIDFPEVRANEVRVRIHVSGINPSDVKKRKGYGEPFTEERIIPHSDGAGVIDMAGSDVDPNRIGERVWVFNGQFNRPFGTAAEYIVLPVSQIVPLPSKIDYPEGACLGIPAMTAHRCLFADGKIAGKTVLVTGGAGAVGNNAIQLAKWAGADVITTVSSPEKEEHARLAGADHVINYKTDDFVTRVKAFTNGQGVDVILDICNSGIRNQ
jgi:NADPH2:quinone reductase